VFHIRKIYIYLGYIVLHVNQAIF